MAVPLFTTEVLQAVCDVLADTSAGLSGSEIGRLLLDAGIDDPLPSYTKRHRLFGALNARQERDKSGNNVAAFIHKAMSPVRFRGNSAWYDSMRTDLNEALSFAGLTLGEDGQLRAVAAATTLSEAEQRASRLHAELRRRNVHADVLAFCRPELLQNYYFHAVLEATKSVA